MCGMQIMPTVPRKHTQSSGGCRQPTSLSRKCASPPRSDYDDTFAKKTKPKFSPRCVPGFETNSKFKIRIQQINFGSNPPSNCTATLYLSYRITSTPRAVVPHGAPVIWPLNTDNPVASYPARPKAEEARLIRY